MARTLAAALAVLAALLADAPARSASADEPLLGIVWRHERTAELVRVDPRSLRRLRGRAVALGLAGSWSFSPDRSRVVVWRSRPDQGGCARGALGFVDPSAMEITGDVEIDGEVTAIAWLSPDRLLALQGAGCAWGPALVIVDVAAQRVVTTIALGGEVVRAEQTRDRLLLLVAPEERIGVPTLLVAGVSGSARTIMLEELRAGAEWGPNGVKRYARPALASDGRRAFVFAAEGVVADVDLASLTVAYHRLMRSESPPTRAPAAAAKASEGSTRHALWLGDGLVALTGNDEEIFRGAGDAVHLRDRPAGLRLVDTRAWSARMLDDRVDWVVSGGGLLFGTRYSWDSSVQKISGIGVVAYDLQGTRRFQLDRPRLGFVALVYRGRAYVGDSAQAHSPLTVVELPAGRIVARRRAKVPRLLIEQASSYIWNGF